MQVVQKARTPNTNRDKDSHSESIAHLCEPLFTLLSRKVRQFIHRSVVYSVRHDQERMDLAKWRE